MPVRQAFVAPSLIESNSIPVPKGTNMVTVKGTVLQLRTTYFVNRSRPGLCLALRSGTVCKVRKLGTMVAVLYLDLSLYYVSICGYWPLGLVTVLGLKVPKHEIFDGSFFLHQKNPSGPLIHNLKWFRI